MLQAALADGTASRPCVFEVFARRLPDGRRFGVVVLLETLVLSILNHDCAIASAAARMVTAAEGRPLIEMGSRRAHEDAAVACARAAYVAGFAGTSNLEAGRRYGIPTRGTSAHSYTLLHDSEAAAFAGQDATHGKDTTLLVDTYDITAGIRTAIEVDGRPVAKRSEHKASRGGRKTAVRRHKASGTAIEEVVVSQGKPEPREHD